MRLRSGLLLAVCLLFYGFPARAQKSPVTATAIVAPDTLRPGEFGKVTVHATVASPYHIYSVVQLPEPAPMPTTLEIDGPVDVEDATGESTPESKLDKGFEKTVGIHAEGDFTRAFRIKADTPPGPVKLEARFRFQACDDRGCLPPKTLTLPITVAVEAGAVRPEYAKPSLPAPPWSPDSAPGTSAPAPAEKPAADQGWAAFLATAFVAGLITLLTPCVFPMIPVTLAFFTKQATKEGATQADRAGVVKLAVLYSIGIVVAFSGLGIVLAAAVGANAARDFAINPWVNLVFTALFVVFGLALLDLFELRLPARLQSVGGKRGAGTLGVLGMGLTFVVSAFTCTAPIVGSLLVLAANAQGAAAFLKPVLGMTVFASALALPFLVLALFPSLLARLPRSGGWMTTLKGAMGFLEIAAAVKFLSNTDIYWNWQILTQPAFLALWAVVLLAGGFWLLGTLRLGHNTPSGPVTPARGAWAGVFIGLGVYCFYGVTGRPMHRSIAQFLPPSMTQYGPLAGAVKEELSWGDDLEAAKQQAKATGKRIFLDMTGHTCTNCRDVETHVMPENPVKEMLGSFIRVRLYTDSGQHATAEVGEKNAKYMEETFQDLTLPRYAILDADGTVLGSTDYTTAKSVDSFGKWMQPLLK